MENELRLLERRVVSLLNHVSDLRAETLSLKKQLETSQQETHALQGRFREARQEVARLIQQLPAEDSQ